jgi:hypothetical protein
MKCTAFVAAAALAVCTAAPLAAGAENTSPPAVLSPVALAAAGPVHLKYDTTLDAQPFGGSAGVYAGTLEITLYPSGVIQGYYRPNNERFVSVTGGFDGKNDVWLDLGFGGREHVDGTFTDTGIVGITHLGGFDPINHFDNDYRFSAVPQGAKPLPR